MDRKSVAARQVGDVFELETDDGEVFRGAAVILATGVTDRQPAVKLTTKPGKILDDVRWIYPWANNETLLYCILCEGHLVRDARVAVFGAGEAAAQVALLLHERYGVDVALLGNGVPLAAAADTRRLMEAYRIRFHEARVVEVLDGGKKPKGASLRGFRLEDGTTVEVRFGMVAGHEPAAGRRAVAQADLHGPGVRRVSRTDDRSAAPLGAAQGDPRRGARASPRIAVAAHRRPNASSAHRRPGWPASRRIPSPSTWRFT